METLGTSRTYTNDPLNNPTTAGYMWSEPTRLQVNELNDSIEMIYEETSLMNLAIHPLLQKRYFKIVFSCVDGKWNKSERIYGKKVEQAEYFVF